MVDDRIKQAGQFVQDAVQESLRQKVSEHGDEEHRRGFSAAAGVTLRRIDAKLDSFEEQMKGAGLTKVEQTVYAELRGLRSEIEAEFDRYWRGSGVDWRPLKPLVTGAVRRAEEAPSEE